MQSASYKSSRHIIQRPQSSLDLNIALFLRLGYCLRVDVLSENQIDILACLTFNMALLPDKQSLEYVPTQRSFFHLI